MTLVWALISITAVLILSGIYTVNRSKAQDSIEFEGFNVKLKTKNAGIAMIVFGLIPIPIAISQVPEKKTVVTAVTLATRDGHYRAQYGSEAVGVRCPIAAPLVGSISVTGDPGTISYRFDRRQGLNGEVRAGEVQTISFDEAGTATVRDNVTANVPMGVVYTEEWLTIVDPGNRQSNPVQIFG